MALKKIDPNAPKIESVFFDLNDQTISSLPPVMSAKADELGIKDPSVSIDDLWMDDQEQFFYRCAMLAIFDEADIYWQNIGSFDTTSVRLYAGAVCAVEPNDEGEVGVIVNFGKYGEEGNPSNIAYLEIETDEDGSSYWALGKAKPDLFIQDEEKMRDGRKIKIKVPYLVIDEVVTVNDIQYKVKFKLNFRFIEFDHLTAAKVDSAFNAGDVESIAELLNTPYKGLGNFCTLNSISNTFLAAKFNRLPTLDFQVIDFEHIPDRSGDGYGDNIDLVLDQDHYIPFTISKNGFVAKNAGKIRLGDNTPGFRFFYGLLQNQKGRETAMAKGLYLRLTGYHAKDPEYFPQHTIKFGTCDPIDWEAFDLERLVNGDQSGSDQAMLPAAQPMNQPITTIAVDAQTVNESSAVRGGNVPRTAVNRSMPATVPIDQQGVKDALSKLKGKSPF